MDPKRSSSRRRSKLAPLRFRLDTFESKLRKILTVESNRRVGTPGSEERALPADPRRAVGQYLIDSLMSKFDDELPGTFKQDTALRKFMVAEEGCYWRNFFFSQETTWIDKTYPRLACARELIYELMGPVVDLERLARGFGFGAGASTRLPKRTGDACYKYSGQPEVTPNAYVLGVAALAANPAWKRAVDIVGEPQIVWGSRFDTVPKNYKTDRAIAIEPCLNMYVQKGIGSYIRQKLKTVGIDLDTQQRNQEGARDLSLATIDFSMASDSVSQGLVKYIMPEAWCDFITMSRSEVVVMPDKTLHRLSKVSSMGNGFTFELETLIFWALAAACVPVSERSRILVYGDDVLIPCPYANDFIELASCAGFTTNTEKTFTDGPFRESCGKHFHSGYDVTPFFIRKPVRCLSDLFKVHNKLRRWITRVDALLSREQYDALQSLCRELRNLAPSKWRKPRIPDGYGDGAFIGSFAEVSPVVHADGWEYFTARVLEEISSVRYVEVPGLLVKSLTNLHKRRSILPQISEPSFQAHPSSGGSRREISISIPWFAYG